ncbi:MAG: HIT family protein [Maricaulaceae bacterium]
MSLIGDYDNNNIFAKILRGDMPCAKVYEDDDVLAFMDVFPQSRGHTLVIPKVPSRNLLDTNADVAATVIQRTQAIAKAVNAALKPDGIIITQFNGAPAGQTVFHLHFHIIPSYEGGDMKPHAAGAMADMAELAELSAAISAKI